MGDPRERLDEVVGIMLEEATELEPSPETTVQDVSPAIASPEPAAPALPARWPQYLMVARLRATGSTQIEAARAAAVSQRTVRTWESSEHWPQAVAESAAAWASSALQAARAIMMGALDDTESSGAPTATARSMARWLSSRLDPNLAPAPRSGAQPGAPAVQVIVAGDGYGFDRAHAGRAGRTVVVGELEQTDPPPAALPIDPDPHPQAGGAPALLIATPAHEVL